MKDKKKELIPWWIKVAGVLAGTIALGALKYVVKCRKKI
jgi:hypothetical protein